MHLFSFCRHSFVCLWRIARGRYYVCRDRPLDYLEKLDSLEPFGDGWEMIDRLIEDARVELRCRSMKNWIKLVEK